MDKTDLIVVTLASAGLDKGTITEHLPELAPFIDESFDISYRSGKLSSLGKAIKVRRDFDNLLAMGFTREEAVVIVSSDAMTKT